MTRATGLTADVRTGRAAAFTAFAYASHARRARPRPSGDGMRAARGVLVMASMLVPGADTSAMQFAGAVLQSTHPLSPD